MKTTILTIALAVGTLQYGFAQTQSSTSERTKEQTQTTVNPDGTAVHHAQTTHERTDSTANPDGTSTTVHTQQRNSHTRVRTDTPVGSKTTESHSSSSSSSSSTTPPVK